jgi:type I restriction enzyme S subunit
MQNMKINDKNQEWIGNIPKNWTFKKIKYVLAQRNEKNIPIKSKDILSLTAKQGVIPYTEKEGGGNKPKTDFSAYKLAYPGDIVMNSMNILSGAVGLSKYFGCVSPVYYMLYCSNDEDDIRYFYYVFANKAFQSSLLGIGNGILMKESENGTFNTIRMRIPIEKLNNMSIPYPKPEIQKAIANFLDKKIGKIDEVSKKIQQEITDLEDYRKSIIVKAVTKGLNLDVPMKDSGIPWIGKMPENWKLEKIKFLCKKIERGTTPNYTDAPLTRVINQATFSKGFFDTKNIKYSTKNAQTSRGLVKKGDVLIASTGGGVLGKVFYFNQSGIYVADSHVTILRTNDKYKSKFAYYVLSVNYDLINGLMAQGSTNQIELQRNLLANFYFPVPNLKSQKEIIAFLDNKCSNIKEIINSKKQELTNLNQYKQSIIYEYVTGKKQVPTEEGVQE